MDIEAALKLAGERGLDLVEVSPDADPPVCKIMDYRKFKFDNSKKLQKAKKKAGDTNPQGNQDAPIDRYP